MVGARERLINLKTAKALGLRNPILAPRVCPQSQGARPPQKLSSAIDGIGIDVGQNAFHVRGLLPAEIESIGHFAQQQPGAAHVS